MTRVDIAVIGGGIAGTTLAAELAPHASVVVLEGESAPGFHATGRSAAFWSETYGGPDVQPLTTASADALAPFLDRLGALHIGRAGEGALIDGFLLDFARSGVELRAVDPATLIPDLRPAWSLGVLEPSCAYIDVAGFHADAISRLKRSGGELRVDAAVRQVERLGTAWAIVTAAGTLRADVIVDAAGAWADPVAALAGARPLGIRAYRRTVVQLRTEPGVPAGIPMVEHIGGSFYFKPEAGGRLWLSPADETAADPGDVAAEEIDVAVAIDRLKQAVDWRVAAVERRWAGLRSFAPDRLPVYGFAQDAPGFFWCAGQGGFGIQTAPAAARLAAALLLGHPPHATVAAIDPARYAPARFG
ncbi:D-arginine dehydrogenase [Sphingomonas guangdongensis]|uniref:D-arginine dehydrogenase n=1 Tax=Sphingomonas guangdongensis TaxID=1141890 RepID=A0A285QEI2_9SPHN|nr:FAD-binding oxidoreductase [Sphingomonas guangdongensis]SOB78547.1 D-arginine dehydrogenase [Sphingomonas guangdongensis]